MTPAGRHAMTRPRVVRPLVVTCMMAALLLPGLVAGAAAQPAGEPPALPGAAQKRILVLLSSHEADPWTLSVMGGMNRVFQQATLDYELWVESLDSRRNRGRGYFKDLAGLFERKFGRVRFDVAVAAGDEALEFAQEYREQLFPGVPLVFGAVHGHHAEALGRAPGTTGAFEPIDFEPTLDLALALHPAARGIVLVTPGLDNRHLVEELIHRFRPDLELEVWSDEGLREVLDRLVALDERMVVVPVGEPRLADGRRLDTAEFVHHITARTSAPVYTVWDVALGHGIVGGRLVSGTAQGALTARLALRVLGGEPVDDIAVVSEGSGGYEFDHRQLERFGIARSALPAGSRVRFQPVSFYETHRTVLWSATAIILALAAFIGALLWNMTVRRRAEQALLAREQQLEAIFQHAPAELCLKDAQGRYVRVNRQFERMYGVEPEGAVGCLPEEVLPREVGTAVRERDRRVLESGDVATDEMSGVESHAEGGLRTLLAVRFPIRGESNEVTGLGSVVSDVTELRSAELELRRRDVQLRQLTEHSRVIAWELDPRAARFVYVSPQARELLGFEPQAWYAEGFLRRQVHPADRDWAPDYAYHQAAEEDDFAFEYRMLDAGGETVWLQEIVNVVRDERGPVLLRGFMFDITDRKRAEHALREREQEFREYAEAELERAREKLVRQTRLSAIGQMSASLAHDIRNPLGSIRNAAYYLKRRVPAGEHKWREYLELVEREVVAADRIISHMMDITRERELYKRVVDIDDLLDGVLRRIDSGGHLEVERDLVPRPFELHADPDQIERVFDNLLNNASQAMAGQGRVVVRARSSATSTTISIIDHGPGVPEQVKEHLFEPLVTTKPKGTGLGLAICDQIVRQHGGGIEHIGTGTGTEFRIHLPADREESAA